MDTNLFHLRPLVLVLVLAHLSFHDVLLGARLFRWLCVYMRDSDNVWEVRVTIFRVNAFYWRTSMVSSWPGKRSRDVLSRCTCNTSDSVILSLIGVLLDKTAFLLRLPIESIHVGVVKGCGCMLLGFSCVLRKLPLNELLVILCLSVHFWSILVGLKGYSLTCAFCVLGLAKRVCEFLTASRGGRWNKRNTSGFTSIDRATATTSTGRSALVTHAHLDV